MGSQPVGQPATPPVLGRMRPAPSLGVRTAKRGFALVRGIVLIGFTGFLVAAVLATIFAGLVVAINGQLP